MQDKCEEEKKIGLLSRNNVRSIFHLSNEVAGHKNGFNFVYLQFIFYCKNVDCFRSHECGLKHSFAKFQVLVTPTRLIILPPETMLSNRVVRHFGEEYALRCVFRDDNGLRLVSSEFSRGHTVQGCFFKNSNTDVKEIVSVECSDFWRVQFSCWSLSYIIYRVSKCEVIRMMSDELYEERSQKNYLASDNFCKQ